MKILKGQTMKNETILTDVMLTFLLALNATPVRGFLNIYILAEVGTRLAKVTVDQSWESSNDWGSSELKLNLCFERNCH